MQELKIIDCDFMGKGDKLDHVLVLGDLIIARSLMRMQLEIIKQALDAWKQEVVNEDMNEG